MDVVPFENRDPLALARERVRVGPVPDWVAPSAYDPDFKPSLGGPVTYLLIERQFHAEFRQSFERKSVRLETMQGVQQRSQWRLEFDPQTHSILIHSIKIRRGATETEHVLLDKIQFLQREAGLEGCVINGSITLLLLLEDVRPGDALEYSYTVQHRPRLLPANVGLLFALPAGVQIGKTLFSVRYSEGRPLKWKSSSQELSATIERHGEEIRSFWSAAKFSPPGLENCTPNWQIDYPWIQISDCPDWQTVASGVLDSWKEDPVGEGLSGLITEIQNFSPEPLIRARHAIDLIQDGFRYLSVNLELGGQIPAPAETVIRRRYGDCKDLAFLLARLLRALGFSARPVLVHSISGRGIAGFLPSPDIFDHAIVEIQIGNEKRWIDATLKCQGGGALNRNTPDFGLGLPIDAATTELVPIPKGSLPSGRYELKETFLLDTSGRPSSYWVAVTARGSCADAFRSEFQNEGLELVARKRLQLYANRFSKAARIGKLVYRDNRDTNEFVLAEAFEIEGFMPADKSGNACVFSIFSDCTAGMLLLPSAAARRTPFALPTPCDQEHTIEIECNGLADFTIPIFQTRNEFFTFSRRTKTAPKFLRMTFALRTLTDSVPADRVQAYRKEIEPVWQAASFRFWLPLGYPKKRQPAGFGALPSVGRAPPQTKPTSPAPVSERPLPIPAAERVQAQLQVRTSVQNERTSERIEKKTPPKEPAAAPVVLSASALPPREDWSKEGYPWRGRTNRRCVRSLQILIGAILCFLSAGLLRAVPGAAPISGLLILLSLGALAWSITLAIIGLRQCVRYPERYSKGRVSGGIALFVGVTFALLLMPLIVSGVRNSSAMSRRRQAIMEPLRFEALHFIFPAPQFPWRQTDAKLFGRGPVLALVRDGPLFFTVCANPLESGYADPEKRLVELCKANLRQAATSYELITERGMTRNGLVGLQTESAANLQGHDCFLIHWMVATNGFGYQLLVWGSEKLKPEIQDEAERLFRGFEVTTPGASNDTSR